MEYITAKKYENRKWVSEVFEDRGKKYVTIFEPCPRCGGTGFVAPWGTCFCCKGSQGRTNIVRVYTPEERAKLDATAQKKTEKRESDKIANATIVKEKDYQSHGFNIEKNVTYMVIGQSYPHRIEIREHGYKFDDIFGWHGSSPIDLPPQLTLIEISLDDLIELTQYGKIYYKTGMKEIVKERVNNELRKTSTSEWLGKEGEYIDVDAIVVKKTGFNSYYGYTNVFTFNYNGNTISWFTSTNPTFSEGDSVHIKAKIKKLDEYMGVRTTVITRPKIQ